MGREKRKGKEIVVEKPVRKWTRAEREAERAEMVAKATEEQASGRARCSRLEIREPGAGAEAEVWAESEVPGPPGPLHSRPRVIRLRGSRQLQSQITQFQMQIQMQRSQSSLRGRVLRGHRLHDVLAALGRRPQQKNLLRRPSVTLDREREEVTSHRSLAGPQQQQQQQLVEPRP